MRDKKIVFAIGISAYKNERTGVGEVYFNIMNNITWDVSVITDTQLTIENDNVHQIILGTIGYKLYKYFRYILPLELWCGKADVVISDAFIPKTIFQTKKVNIIHDIMSCIYPKNYTKKQHIIYSMIYSKLKSDKNILVLAASECTKQDIINYLNLDEARIYLFPQTVNFQVTKNNTESTYLFYIGDMRKNKNILNMIKALKIYNEKNKRKLKFIIAGSRKYEYENLQNFVKENDIMEFVSFPGYVSVEMKKELYAGAKALFFCSTYEGFGLPLLEASFNNILFIASDIPVFREVIKDTGLLCNSADPNDIARRIELLDDQQYIKKLTNAEKQICAKYCLERYKIELKELCIKLFQNNMDVKNV